MDGPVMAGGFRVGVGGKSWKGRWATRVWDKTTSLGAAPNQEPPPPLGPFSPAARWTRDFFFVTETHMFFFQIFQFSILTFSTGGKRGEPFQNHLFLFFVSVFPLLPPSVPSGVVDWGRNL